MENLLLAVVGHVDHGKTTLTKALTSIDTDKLKEEKKRGLSIEIGIAPFQVNETYHLSIIDVPGHKDYIKNMILGVGFADLAILVISAIEGVMPQTIEHVNILSRSDVNKGIVVVSNCNSQKSMSKEMLANSIEEITNKSKIEWTKPYYVDSKTQFGFEDLKAEIKTTSASITTKCHKKDLRLYIDKTFIVKGRGTVVRGTIKEGKLSREDSLILLPQGYKIRPREIQVHNTDVECAKAGQRVAINLIGIKKEEITKGSIIVHNPNYYKYTNTLSIDLALFSDINFKSSFEVRCYIGYTEIIGRIKRVVGATNDELDNRLITCELKFKEKLIAKVGDKILIRSVNFDNLIGTGIVVNVSKSLRNFRYTKNQKLEQEILEIIEQQGAVRSVSFFIKHTIRHSYEVERIIMYLKKNENIVELKSGYWVIMDEYVTLRKEIILYLRKFHELSFLDFGVKKEVLIAAVNENKKFLINLIINDLIQVKQLEMFHNDVALYKHQIVSQNSRYYKVEKLQHKITNDSLEVRSIYDYLLESDIGNEYFEKTINYLMKKNVIYKLTNNKYITKKCIEVISYKIYELKSKTFTLQEAKNITKLSRSKLVLFLELLDNLNLTVRIGDYRKWNEGTYIEFIDYEGG